MVSILLIDDDPKVLAELQSRLAELLRREAEIRCWTPSRNEEDPLAIFNGAVNKDTVLVVTDYDLTGQGRTGLFGASVVAWCQGRRIPVGDYSRALKSELPEEPNLFELRVPKMAESAAHYIAAVFRGFNWIRQKLAARPELLESKRSPPAVIATLLDVPALESQFALYSVRLGATSAALVERIVHFAPGDKEPSREDKRALLAYIIGHLLLNSILRFPGPIVSSASLAAYLGVSGSESDRLQGMFKRAMYEGPFWELGPFFWLAKVDEFLRPWIGTSEASLEGDASHGEVNREALEKLLGMELNRHECGRCNGQNGGFWCPFMRRAVCLRKDCSVGANSWVPQGARLCRIERDFYDEWSPILGI